MSEGPREGFPLPVLPVCPCLGATEILDFSAGTQLLLLSGAKAL